MGFFGFGKNKTSEEPKYPFFRKGERLPIFENRQRVAEELVSNIDGNTDPKTVKYVYNYLTRKYTTQMIDAVTPELQKEISDLLESERAEAAKQANWGKG
jgi:hypothetical protein